MNRKEFLHHCGFTCLGLVGLAVLTESCGTTRTVNGQLTEKQMQVPLTDFRSTGDGQTRYKPFIVVRNVALNYPIVVYRRAPDVYEALLLRCTHQGAVLSVAGELLTCPAHGSEFNTKGEVVQGPASASLRQFSTRVDAQTLYIDLA